MDPEDVRYYENSYDDQPMEALTPIDMYFGTQNPDVANVYKAIHVTESTKRPLFNLYNGYVRGNLSYSGMYDVSNDYEALLGTTGCLNNGTMQECAISMLVYAGEFDAIHGANSQQDWLSNLNFQGSSEFKSQARKIYYLNATLTNEWQVGGYYRQVPLLTYLAVPGAGWAVDYDNNLTSYNAFLDFVRTATQSHEGLTCKRNYGYDGCSVVD